MTTFTSKNKTLSTCNHTFIYDKLIELKDLETIQFLIECSYIGETDKNEFLLHLIDSKPNFDIIKYIAQYCKSPVVIDKLLSQNYGCNEMESILEYIVVNKNLSNDLYTKIYRCFTKLSSLPDYHIYEMNIRYLHCDFLENESVPDYLIEKILSSNITLFTPNEKLQKVLLRKNLPQYMLEYIIVSFDDKSMKYVHYDIQQRTRILNLKQRFENILTR